MVNKTYFVKSLEEDFKTKTLEGDKKVDFQSIEDILVSRQIKPNTKSFGQDYRLSTTILHKNYLKTYRPQGIIFITKENPAYVVPFDLVLLSDAEKIVVHYYRIKDNLHFYYNHQLVPGFEYFIFSDFRKLLEEFPTHKDVWEAVNSFRTKAGFKELPKSKHRLIEYNEAVFEKPIHIEPVAIFGYSKKAREVAKSNNLPHYKSAKDFYHKIFDIHFI